MSDNGKPAKVVKRKSAKIPAKRQVLRIVAYEADGFPVTFDGKPYRPGMILYNASAETAERLIAEKLAVWSDTRGLQLHND